MTNFTVDVSQIVLFIGVMAFIVSIITEALKKWTWFDKKVPTALTVIILSLILCPVCLLGLAAYYGVAIEWFMVFASFIAAFIVALVSMDGWEGSQSLQKSSSERSSLWIMLSRSLM